VLIDTDVVLIYIIFHILVKYLMKVYFLKVYKLRLSFGVSRIFHSIRPKEKGILKYEAIFYINIIINLLIRFFIP